MAGVRRFRFGATRAVADLWPASSRGALTRRGAFAAWAMLTALTLGLFVLGLPPWYRQTLRGLAEPQARAALSEVGLSVSLFMAVDTVLLVVFMSVFAGVAGLLALRRPHDPVALLGASMLVTLAASFPGPLYYGAQLHPIASMADRLVLACSWSSLLLFFLLFPDGRFVPSWTRWLAAVALVLIGLSALFPGTPADSSTWGVAGTLLTIAHLGSLAVAQVYRYRRVSGPVERQQTKWVVLGITGTICGLFGVGAVVSTIPGYNQSGSLSSLANTAMLYLLLLLIPLSLAAAILRYKLFDIDVVLNRALVYGALTTSVVGAYVLVVGGLGALLRGRADLLVSLLATGLVALLFAPLRHRLQRAVDRLMYGERDDPYAVLSRLGQRLEGTLAPDTIVPAVVQTVRDALKLPYAAVELDRDGVGRPPTAFAGSPVANALRLPLHYQGAIVGWLVLGPRAGEAAFSDADRRLLADLSRQVGIAVHSVRLTDDLRASNEGLRIARERLVSAREEERRRLRRDLHDGLGPALAAESLKVGAIRKLLDRDRAVADALLLELGGDIEATINDIRRLVYDLRPPALDELGLAGAIRERVAHHHPRAMDGGPEVTVEAPEPLPPLPAAVEVAAYRIAHEALTNVARHARARRCSIRLSPERGALCLEIIDDGVGLPTERRAGVGLVSMRERAEELGGSLSAGALPSGGTRVAARLPLGEE